MTKEMLYELLGDIDERFIAETEIQRSPQRAVWLRWAAAACLCLTVCLAAAAIGYEGWLSDSTPPWSTGDLQEEKTPGYEWGNTQEEEDLLRETGRLWEDTDDLQPVSMLLYNGAQYEVSNAPAVLVKAGLPGEITEDMAGERLAYLRAAEGNDYEVVSEKADAELYRYTPAACDAVYILRDGDVWYAALFNCFVSTEESAGRKIQELFHVYGIDGAEDVISVTEMDQNQKKSLGEPVKDRRELDVFYNTVAVLEPYDTAAFEQALFADVPEESAAEAHSAFAEDHRTLRLETAEGLYLYLPVFLKYGWINGGGALSYYRMDEQLCRWFERNFK